MHNLTLMYIIINLCELIWGKVQFPMGRFHVKYKLLLYTSQRYSYQKAFCKPCTDCKRKPNQHVDREQEYPAEDKITPKRYARTREKNNRGRSTATKFKRALMKLDDCILMNYGNILARITRITKAPKETCRKSCKQELEKPR